MTIPTILTQGSTTHLKEGLPVTTVSNLGAMTPASESLIMSIKKTADDALAAAGGGGGGGGGGSGSQEDIDDLKNRMTNVETKTTQNSSKITALETKETATSNRVDGHDTEIASLKQKNTEQDNKITAVENAVNSMKSDVESNASDIAKVDSKLTSLESSIDNKLSELDTAVDDLEKKHDSDIAKIDSLLDTTVITDAQLEQQETGEYKLSTSSTNLKTQDDSSASFLIDLADSNKSGLMPKESYKQIEEISKTVESLSQGGVWRGTYDTYQDLVGAYPDLDVDSTNWTANDYVEVENDSEHDGNATRYIVSIVDGKKELVFQKVITAKIEQATSDSLGVVKGSENTTDNKYKIFVEQDGTMSLIGGAELDKSISDLDSKIDDTATNLQNNIDTVESDLTTKIDDLDTKIDDTKTELQKNITDLETDLKKEIADGDQALSDRIDEVEYKALPYSSFVGKAITQYTFCEYDGLIFQAIADIEEVPTDFDETQWKQIGGRKFDEVTINANADGKLQAIGYIEKNKEEPEYNWTGTYAEWVDGRNNGTIPDEWICKITDDFVEDNHKVFYHILELWYSYRTDDYQDGAYAADGREFYKSDFKSEDESSNPYNILVEQGNAITYEQYQAIIDEYGFCGKFAIDTENEKFKLPTIRDCYIRAGENIGETLKQTLPNVKAWWDMQDRGNNNPAYQPARNAIKYKKQGATYYTDRGSQANNNNGFEFDASKYDSTYQDDAKVLPDSIVLKPMIQLINYIPKDVSIDFVNNTERQIQNLKAVINTLNLKLEEVSNSFIPDYSKKVSITSGYVTQERGKFQLNCNNYSSTPHVYFNGVEVWTGCLYSSERMQSNCFLTVEAGVTITWSIANSSSLNALFIPFKTQPNFGGGAVYPDSDVAETVNEIVDKRLLTTNTIRLVDEQKPTAENNYAWYRLYSDGWIEQGGVLIVPKINANSVASVNCNFILEQNIVNNALLAPITDNGNSWHLRHIGNELHSDYIKVYFANGSSQALSTGDGLWAWQVKGYAKVAPPANLDIYRNYQADYVVEESYSYTNENNWSSWQIYKSGKIIMNGQVKSTATGTNTLNFPVELADTHYSITFGYVGGENTTNMYGLEVSNSRTTSSVKYKGYANNPMNWMIIGKIKTT